jgi:hypothetical protein
MSTASTPIPTITKPSPTSELCVRVRNEIRSCVATKIMSSIFQMGTMTVRKIDSKFDEMFHGTKDVISHLEMVIKGIAPYDQMFDESVSIVTSSFGDANPSNLVLSRNHFLLDKDYVMGRHFTKTFLANKTTSGLGGLVRGRALHSIAKKSLANMKKALAFLRMLPEVEELTKEGVVFKSGIGEEEVKSKLLDLMYIELNGKPDDEKADEITVDDEDDGNIINVSPESENGRLPDAAKSRPFGWFFSGWFAFCLFGPFVNEHQRLTIFEEGSNKQDNLKINGRAAKREVEKKESDIHRNNDNNTDRGISMTMKIGFATLELKSKEIEMKSQQLSQQEKEGKIIALNLAIQDLNQDIDRAEQRAHRFCPEYDDEHTMWVKVNILETEKEKLKQHLHELVVSKLPNTTTCNDILNKYVIIDEGPSPKRAKNGSSKNGSTKNGSTESSDFSTNSSK